MSVDIVILKDFLVAILLGALIGMEREVDQQIRKIKDFAGVRTFILITLLGAMVGYLSKTVFETYMFVIVAFFAVALLAIVSHVMINIQQKRAGSTTLVSVILAFVIGVMTTVGAVGLAVVFTVLITAFLAFKPLLHGLAKKVDKKDMYATLEFAVISLVVLPLLPNFNYSPLDIPVLNHVIENIPNINLDIVAQLNVFNPYKIWLMVIFISGISFVGFVLTKIIGPGKGIGLTGAVGGLVSSTAVTSSLSIESKNARKMPHPFVLGVVLAWALMFIRVLFEVLVINVSILKYMIVPLGVMALTCFVAGGYLYHLMKSEHKKHFNFSTPFALMPALKFGFFFAFVLFIAKLAAVLWGSSGIYLASFLSGLADVDAITISMANLAKNGDIGNMVAVTAITIAAVTNTLVKMGIAFVFGSRKFSKSLGVICGIVVVLGLLAALII